MPDSPTSTGENDRPPKDPELVALGSRIRELRAAAGKTQERVASDAGIHWTYVGQVERGERNPSFKNLVKLARGLEQPLSQVVDGL